MRGAGVTQKPPCTCDKHKDGATQAVDLGVLGVHGFQLDTYGFDAKWRWLCWCGSRGQWQNQSDSAAYHAWLRHVGLDYS